MELKLKNPFKTEAILMLAFVVLVLVFAIFGSLFIPHFANR